MHPLLALFDKNSADRAQHLAACDQTLSLDYRGFRAVACGQMSATGLPDTAGGVAFASRSSTSLLSAAGSAGYQLPAQ